MSLPSLKDVLRSIHTHGGSGSRGRDRGNTASRASNAKFLGQQQWAVNAEMEHLAREAPRNTHTSGGQRRRRYQGHLESDANNSDWDSVNSPSTHSNYLPGSTSPGGQSWGRSVSWTESEPRAGSTFSQQSWDGSEELGQRLAVTPNGGGSTNGSTCGIKRARVGGLSYPFPLSLSSDDGKSMLGDTLGSSGCGGRVSGGQEQDGLSRSAPLLEQRFVETQSHSTAEWMAMQKAARVLGVDSLEQRDVEDRHCFSTRKAAQILGVDTMEMVRKMQESAEAGSRQKWAPPRSSASKAAPMLGVEDVSVLQEQATSTRSRSTRHGKPRQNSISYLIRALEIGESQESGAVDRGSGNMGGSNRSEFDTGSAHSTFSSATRGTESCSSIDLTLTDSDGARACGGGSGAMGSGRIMNKPVLPDEQIAGLETPAQAAAAEAQANGGFKVSRDDMEIETPLCQPRSDALISLRQAPAPLVAPFASFHPSTCKSSPSPRGAPGPDPSPAGSPVGPLPILGLRQISDVAVGVRRGEERSPTPLKTVARGKGGGGRTGVELPSPLSRVAEGKGPIPVRSEALGDEHSGVGWTRPASAPLPAPVPALIATSTAAAAANDHAAANGAHNRQPQMARTNENRRLSPPATPMSSPIGPAADWRSGSSAPLVLAVAGAKETQPQRAYDCREYKNCMEYKQEAPVRQHLLGRECSPPPSKFAGLTTSCSGEFSPYGEGHGGRRSAYDMSAAELKDEANGAAPGVGIGRRGWLAPPGRPSSAPVTGVPQQHLQTSYHGRSFSPSTGPVERPRSIAPNFTPDGGGFSTGVGVSSAGGGFTPSYERRVNSSDSSGETGSEGTGEPYNLDRMSDEECVQVNGPSGVGHTGVTGGAGAGSYSALAALIPFVDAPGIGPPGPAIVAPAGLQTVVKQEASVVVVAPPQPQAPKAKPRRRSAPAKGGLMNVSAAVSQPVALSPVMTIGHDVRAATGSFTSTDNTDQPMDVGVVTGISTKKQQEVATRPRIRGRFVKRPPAFLPYSAFKPAGERSEADIAAERAEEAREEAVELAARAAEAAAAVAAGQNAVSASVAPSKRSPPPATSDYSEGGAVGNEQEEQAAPWAMVAGSRSGGSDGSADGKQERRRQAPNSGAEHPSNVPASARAGRAGSGGSGGGRGRSERAKSPAPRTPHTDIWTGHDCESENGERTMPGPGAGHDSASLGSTGGRDRSVSDCGSERGSDDLRGMAFLPFSPVGGEGVGSPRSSWDSPRRSMFSATGSCASTPSSAAWQRGGGHDAASRVTGMHSPRPVPHFSETAASSTEGDSTAPWEDAMDEGGEESGEKKRR